MDDAKLKWIYLALLSLIWGSSFILIDQAMKGLSFVQVGALRITVTAFFLFSVGLNTIKLIKKSQWKWIESKDDIDSNHRSSQRIECKVETD